MQPFVIAPSILSADFARLGEEVDNVLAAGADWVHFDVMDNHYVPNLTIGPMVCQALRKHGVTAPIDVHLMVEPVDRIVPDFAEAGASLISFHPEASRHVHRTIQLIRSLGCKPGIVLNPATPVDILDWVLDDLDLVLLMSVNPGFGGQSFVASQLRKIEAVRKAADAAGVTDEIIHRSRAGLLVAAVGPVTAAPLQAQGVAPLVPERSRMGALVRAVLEHYGDG